MRGKGNGEVTGTCPKSSETQSQDLKPRQPDYKAQVLKNHHLTPDGTSSTAWSFAKTTEGRAEERGVGSRVAPLGDWSPQSEGSRVGWGPQDRRRAQIG